MKHAITTTLAALLLVAPIAAQALPYGAQISQVGTGDEMIIQVDVQVHIDSVDHPQRWILVRRTTAPEMASLQYLMDDWQDMPDPGESSVGQWSDPGLADLSVGYYEVIAEWEGGGDEVLDHEALSLAEHPYVLRGILVSETELEPCTDGDLLECTTVSLADPAWWTDIAPGTLLDIYGWPTRLDAVDDCDVNVTWVEPMPAGADCNDPMPVLPSTWSSIRALYE